MHLSKLRASSCRAMQAGIGLRTMTINYAKQQVTLRSAHLE
jgi:hypothetical protein